MVVNRNFRKYVFLGDWSKLDLFCVQAQDLECIHFDSSKIRGLVSEIATNRNMFVSVSKILNLYSASLECMNSCLLYSPPIIAASFLDIANSIIHTDEQIAEHKQYLKKIRMRLATDAWVGIESCKQLYDEVVSVLKTVDYNFHILRVSEGADMIQFYYVYEWSVFIGDWDNDKWYIYISKDTPNISGVSVWKYTTYVTDMVDNKSSELVKFIRYMRLLVDSHDKVKILWNEHLNFLFRNAVLMGANDVLADKSVFSLIGWVGVEDIGRVSAMLTNYKIAAIEIPLEENEVAPVKLENEGLDMIGEELLLLYDVPGSTDEDPSRWIIYGSLVFIGMILCDIGYGLVIVLLGEWLYYNCSMNVRDVNYKKAIRWAGVSACLWGAAFNWTVFGVEIGWLYPEIPSVCNSLVDRKIEYLIDNNKIKISDYDDAPENVLSKTQNSRDLVRGLSKEQLMVNKNLREDVADAIWLEMSVIVGVVHIISALLLVVRSSIENIFWVSFILCAYVGAIDALQTDSIVRILVGSVVWPSYDVALEIMGGALICVVLVGVWRNGVLGVFKLLDVLQLFSDVLSYLRIYALSLSGVVMAKTLNMTGMSFGIILCPLILCLGHIVNFIIGVSGSLVHGVRLNFIEWLHHTFQGGGYLFAPLRKIKENK